MELVLDDNITRISGIGEKKSQTYRRLGVHTVRQLLLYLPRDYLDLTMTRAISECEMGKASLVRAQVTKKLREQCIRKGLSIFKVEADDGTQTLRLTFFNTKFAVEALKLGQSYLFYGVIGGTLLNPEMSSPVIIPTAYAGGLMPVYPTVAGISSRVIAQDIRKAIFALTEPFAETLPEHLRAGCGLIHLEAAVRQIHAPKDLQACEEARSRILFEELLVFSIAMLRLRTARNKQTVPSFAHCDLRPFYKSLPFIPTKGQADAIADIAGDLTSGNVMSRLIQGDVGSGKTLVAAAAAYTAWKNNKQTALMAPTELLAEQHYKTLSTLLGGLGIRVALMTGSLRAAERRALNTLVAEGNCDVVVGTHALISGSTEFLSLGLVITDEQHRFGVAQRAALTAKGKAVHTLVMSATPIPRTLSLIVYGDLDVSLIKELPPGRTPVETYRINSAKRQRAFGFIKDHLNQGRQAYIVCPLVGADDKEPTEQNVELELHSAVEYAKQLSEGEFNGYVVGLLHGKMKPADKENVMARFASGAVQLLVATTVVEVGVDVPNAAVMLIENAERFGLSQLHQLRGRVGRGQHKSYCILVTDSKSQMTAERLSVLVATNDGFRIAEEDLRLRGPGDILGARQHGLPGLENADLVQDAALFSKAQQAAVSLLQEDPALSLPEHKTLAQAVKNLFDKVGENPN